MLLKEALEIYVSTNPQIQSDDTARRYQQTIVSLEKFLERPATIDDLNADTYGRWVIHRRDVLKRASTTVYGEAQKLLVIWRWLAARADNEVQQPNVMLPKKFTREPETWTLEEYTRLETSARRCEWFVGEVPGKVYWPAFIGVMVETGERLGAVHKLQMQHFDFTKLSVRFPAEIRKGQTRDLTRDISLQTARDVQLLGEFRPRRPFAALLQNSMYHPWRRLLVDAGLPCGRDKMYHNLRRYHATQVALQGGDATRSLDHSDPRVTARYVDARQLGPEPMPKRPQERKGWFRWFPRPRFS